jgi:hypothetical protein
VTVAGWYVWGCFLSWDNFTGHYPLATAFLG